MTPPHPTRTIRLYAYAGATLSTGVLGLILQGNLDHDSAALAPALGWLTAGSFVLFIVVCAAGVLGWLMREHEIWRRSGGADHDAALALARVSAEAQAAADPEAAWMAQRASRYADEAEDDDPAR